MALARKNAITGRPRHYLANEIANIWLAKTAEASGPVPATDIHRELLQRFRKESISIRTVQGHVRELKKRHGASPELPKVFWNWGDASPDALGVAFVLRLNTLSKAVYGRPVWTTEAAWASRLVAALHGLDPFVQLFVVREYALRERIAGRRGEPKADTGDLDDLLGLRPWLDGRSQDVLPWHVYYFQMEEPGARGTGLLDWVVRSLRGVERAEISWHDVVRAARGQSNGLPWSLSDRLFSAGQGGT